MKSIRSRFSMSAYMGMIVMSTILCSIMVMILSYIKEDFDMGRQASPILIFTVVMVFGLFLFCIFTFSQNLRKVTLNSIGIVVKSITEEQSYKWSELNEIETTGKQNIGMVEYCESIKFTPHKGRRILIAHDTIANISEVCQAMEHIKAQLTHSEQPSLDTFQYKKDNKKVTFDDRRSVRYGKNHIFSGNGLFMLFTLAMAIKCISLFINFYDTSSFTYLFSVGLFIPLLIMVAGSSAWQMFFFELNDTHLVVRNPVMPAWERVYPLADILISDSEQHYRQSRSLRIITKSYESRLFIAGSLSSSEWKDMFKNLRFHEIDTRIN